MITDEPLLMLNDDNKLSETKLAAKASQVPYNITHTPETIEPLAVMYQAVSFISDLFRISNIAISAAENKSMLMPGN